MAGPYYVDPAGSNTSPYDTWTKAATNLQTVVDLIRAGEICYCRGHQDLAAAITLDTAAATGTNAAGFVKFIGCNASGENDGTYFTLHCNGQSIHGINANGAMDLVWLENIEVYGSAAGSYAGLHYSGGAGGIVLNHCSLHNMGGHGVNASFWDTSLIGIRSAFYANGGSGVYAVNESAKFVFCSFHDNNDNGVVANKGALIGCLVYDNGDDGVGLNALCGLLFGCVIDQNADDGIAIDAEDDVRAALVIACRITNQSGEAADIGLNANSEPFVYGWNYIFHNGDNLANTTIAQAITVAGVDTNTVATEDSGNVDLDGYTSITDGSEDYNLASDATARRTAVSIPLT